MAEEARIRRSLWCNERIPAVLWIGVECQWPKRKESECGLHQTVA
jgi:hypothetical protein